MTTAVRLALAGLLILVADPAPSAQVVFRARSDVVMVPVWVTGNPRAVHFRGSRKTFNAWAVWFDLLIASG